MRQLVLLCQVLLAASSGAQTFTLSLDQAIGTALQHRPAVTAAEEKLAAALANRAALSANPPTRIETGYGTRPELGIGNDLLFAQPLDLFGKTQANHATGQAGVLAAMAAFDQERLDLQAEVVSGFAETLSAQALVDTGQDLADLAARSYGATKKRIDAGDLPPAQLLRADLELRRAKQTLALRHGALTAARARLAASLGIPTEQIETLSGLVAAPPIPPPLASRPDLAQIRSDVASAKADVAVAAASRWPDLELQVAHDYWDSSGRYVGRVQLVVPIFDWGAARERIKAGKASQASATASLQDRTQSALRDVEATRGEYESARQASQGFDRLTQDARSLLENEQRAFALGASSLLDVLDATRALRETEESAIDAKTQWIQAEGRYLTATGTLLIHR